MKIVLSHITASLRGRNTNVMCIVSKEQIHNVRLAKFDDGCPCLLAMALRDRCDGK